MILPVSRVSISASRPAFSATRSARRGEQLAARRCRHRRPGTGVEGARLAASTARSTSPSRASGISAQASPVAGSRLWERALAVLEAAVDVLLEASAWRSRECRHDVVDEPLERRLLALEAHTGVDPDRVFVVAQRLVGLEPGDDLVGSRRLRRSCGITSGEYHRILASSSSVSRLDQALRDRASRS